jgi:hypothetical protein
MWSVAPGGGLGVDVANWILGCGFVFGALFGSGQLILGQTRQGLELVALAIACGAAIIWNLRRHGFESFGK